MSHKLENLIAIKNGVTENLSELLVVSLLHHSHLVQLEWFLQRIEEILDFFSNLKNQLLGSHLGINVEKDEVLNCLCIYQLSVLLVLFVQSTEAENDLTYHTSDTSNTGSLLRIASDFNKILNEDVLSRFSLGYEKLIDFFL